MAAPPVQHASARELERRRARAARLSAPAHEPGEGWRLDSTSAARIAALFSRLSLRPGYRLITYAWHGGIGGRGATFAVPEKVIDQLIVPAADPYERPAPPGALRHFMEALEGDGSLRSFIQASIVRRELEELGAFWHGLSWSTHTLVGPAPDGSGPVTCGETPYGKLEGPLSEPSWHWLEPAPADWRPIARRGDDGGVVVRFHSYSEFQESAVYAHVDEYSSASGLVPALEDERILARGPGGFDF